MYYSSGCESSDFNLILYFLLFTKLNFQTFNALKSTTFLVFQTCSDFFSHPCYVKFQIHCISTFKNKSSYLHVCILFIELQLQRPMIWVKMHLRFHLSFIQMLSFLSPTVVLNCHLKLNVWCSLTTHHRVRA